VRNNSYEIGNLTIHRRLPSRVCRMLGLCVVASSMLGAACATTTRATPSPTDNAIWGSTETAVWRRVQEMNLAWTKGRVQDLGDFFHSEAVAITPLDHDALVGAERCIASWQRFAEAATNISWTESDPRVRVFENVAVVNYNFDVTYKMNGAERRDRGRDMVVLIRAKDKWLVIADQFSPFPTP
jgi:hypothetical protein